MYKPNFRYTNKIVKLLTQVSAAREIVFNSPLVPKWEISLRKEAIMKSTHASTAIEGNRLTLEQVEKLADGKKIIAIRKDKEEVLNYLHVLENLDKLNNEKKITEKNILNIHKKLTKGTLENNSDCGKYRTHYVVVGNTFTGDIIFRPPQNKEVQKLVQNFLDWVNSTKIKELDPVIQAGISHYEIVRIHPFIDGNGRTARVIASLVLYLREFDIKQFFCLDDYYDSDRSAYYRALQTVDPKTIDITKWLEYFVQGVNISINIVKDRINRLSLERTKKTKQGQIALNERQMKIIEHLNQYGNIKVGEMSKMFNISRQASLKVVNKLKELGVVRLVGKGRGAHYVLR